MNNTIKQLTIATNSTHQDAATYNDIELILLLCQIVSHLVFILIYCDYKLKTHFILSYNIYYVNLELKKIIDTTTPATQAAGANQQRLAPAIMTGYQNLLDFGSADNCIPAKIILKKG